MTPENEATSLTTHQTTRRHNLEELTPPSNTATRIPEVANSRSDINLLKPTGHVMHQQFNIQQLYVLPTLYLCVLYLSQSKQRLVPLTV